MYIYSSALPCAALPWTGLAIRYIVVVADLLLATKLSRCWGFGIQTLIPKPSLPALPAVCLGKREREWQGK